MTPNTTHRRLLVTSALPYANGAIHLGHLVEYIQTDIWVRFQRSQGHTVHYVCADDTHGTPIMLRAQAEGITPEALIARVGSEHQRDFASFCVGFDHYHSTHAPENRVLCEQIYTALQSAGLIEQRAVEQFYDPVKNMFLPDRFIKGECPKCGAKDQYGDSCEVCGATYQPTDLKNAYSTVSGAAPVRKVSEHYFFKLSHPQCEAFLREWVQTPGRLQPEAMHKMQEWLGEKDSGKLADWDISRDAPYFGFEIPGAPGKYFYVWLDAPVGYFASFRHLCQMLQAQGMLADAKQYEEQFVAASGTADANTQTTELVHFIGKDILYFHALFWPAMLQFSGFRTPTHVFAHGFLTVNGAKMSKSRGTFITAESYMQQGFNPEWLRYYLAAKLNNTLEDLDLNLDDFAARVNSDLVGKYINIASRAAGFLQKRFGGALCATNPQDPTHNALLQHIQNATPELAQFYNDREYSKAIRLVMQLADRVNEYVDKNKPWELAKQPENEATLHQVCSQLMRCFAWLTRYLSPVLPQTTRQVAVFLNVPEATLCHWQAELNISHTAPFQHLMQRIDAKHIEALLAANQNNLQASPTPQTP